jgi:hypothetical protein
VLGVLNNVNSGLFFDLLTLGKDDCNE